MEEEVVILVTEDDPGHANLIRKNLRRGGVRNEIRHFQDGQDILDFFFGDTGPEKFDGQTGYVLFLDIRMPKVDGIDVLRRLKGDERLRKIPVIILTTTDDPREIDRCYELGCNQYITKPLDYEKFVEAVKYIGSGLMVNQIPRIGTL